MTNLIYEPIIHNSYGNRKWYQEQAIKIVDHPPRYRELLLPKLIDREIDVSELDIKVNPT
ncbi:MAG: hypothetical protein HQK88_06905 [Nitrospirae bacterium]|nr:hypothetical protein [Nitrospirota bacterium]MBF0535023.1 hypothetical protein [Nitrospirota bacterium]MBF0616531.1 hypothetical protein [Nitrospirota bacterium]